MKKIAFSTMIISLVLGFIQEQLPETFFKNGFRELLIFALWCAFLIGLHIIIQENEKDGIKPRK